MPEDQNTEYKQSWRDEYLKWICGFANSEGGVLHIGRDDRGRVTGLTNAGKLMEDIPNKIRDVLGIMADVNLHSEKSKNWIEIRVDPYPYTVNCRGKYFYRSGSTNQELKGAALDRFIMGKQGRRWDAVPVPGIDSEDLSPWALETFRGKAKKSGRMHEDLLDDPDAVLLEKLRLTENGYLKRAALLLFGKDPEKMITGAYVKIGFFRTHSDLLYHDEIHGDLFSQLETVLELLYTKYLKARITYDGLQRIETFPVPRTGFREALINAAAHKDYAVPAPVQIRVYPDRLMIWNPGQIPERWTMDRLLGEHASVPFNPDIAGTLFRAAYLESWGRGIDLIRSECIKAGNHEPRFEWDNGLWVEFPFDAVEASENTTLKTQWNTLKTQGTTIKTQGTALKTRETTQKTPLKDQDTTLKTQGTTLKPPLKDQDADQETVQERILDLIRADPSISGRAAAEIIGLSEDGVKYHLGRLREAGLLRRTGPKRGGRWEVIE